jgi:hypothetical protein
MRFHLSVFLLRDTYLKTVEELKTEKSPLKSTYMKGGALADSESTNQ